MNGKIMRGREVRLLFAADDPGKINELVVIGAIEGKQRDFELTALRVAPSRSFQRQQKLGRLERSNLNGTFVPTNNELATPMPAVVGLNDHAADCGCSLRVLEYRQLIIDCGIELRSGASGISFNVVRLSQSDDQRIDQMAALDEHRTPTIGR
jgi:hypothetical protein